MSQEREIKKSARTRFKRLAINEKQKRLQGVTWSLSNPYYWYLVSGEWKQNKFIDEDGNIERSKIEYAIIFRLVSMRYDKETIRNVFEAFACKDLYYWSVKGKSINDEGDTWFDYEIMQANIHYNQNRNHDFDFPADRILEQCKYFPVISNSIKNTLLAIIIICKEVGSFNNIALPVRRVAVKAGCSKDTSCNHIKKLCEGKWKKKNGEIVEFKFMEKIETAEGYKSAIYNVFGRRIAAQLSKGTDKGIVEEPEFEPFCSMANHSNLDEYYYYNLGKIGKSVVDIFLDNPGEKYSIRDLCKKINASFPTVKKKLDALVNSRYILTEKEKTIKRDRSVYWMEKAPKEMKKVISPDTEDVNEKRRKQYIEESEKFKKRYY